MSKPKYIHVVKGHNVWKLTLEQWRAYLHANAQPDRSASIMLYATPVAVIAQNITGWGCVDHADALRAIGGVDGGADE